MPALTWLAHSYMCGSCRDHSQNISSWHSRSIHVRAQHMRPVARHSQPHAEPVQDVHARTHRMKDQHMRHMHAVMISAWSLRRSSRRAKDSVATVRMRTARNCKRRGVC